MQERSHAAGPTPPERGNVPRHQHPSQDHCRAACRSRRHPRSARSWHAAATSGRIRSDARSSRPRPGAQAADDRRRGGQQAGAHRARETGSRSRSAENQGEQDDRVAPEDRCGAERPAPRHRGFPRATVGRPRDGADRRNGGWRTGAALNSDPPRPLRRASVAPRQPIELRVASAGSARPATDRCAPNRRGALPETSY